MFSIKNCYEEFDFLTTNHKTSISSFMKKFKSTSIPLNSNPLHNNLNVPLKHFKTYRETTLHFSTQNNYSSIISKQAKPVKPIITEKQMMRERIEKPPAWFSNRSKSCKGQNIFLGFQIKLFELPTGVSKTHKLL